jgi:hypothetical protein
MTNVLPLPSIETAIGTGRDIEAPGTRNPIALDRGDLYVAHGLFGPRREPQVSMQLHKKYDSNYTEVRLTPALARELAQWLAESADLAEYETEGPAPPPSQ